MNTILFDLDGTLLPMDQDLFIQIYFSEMAKTVESLSYTSEDMKKAVWVGTKAMIENDGSMTNENRFWESFASILGEEIREIETDFHKFYKNEFSKAKVATTPTSLANETIKMLKEKGYTLVLATNPLFPRVATLERMSWAGLDSTDFELITTYENSRYCKPKLEYYKEILKEIKKDISECIMIGNDVVDDMCVKELGMNTFLLTDCLIDNGKDISKYKRGSFDELYAFTNSLPQL